MTGIMEVIPVLSELMIRVHEVHKAPSNWDVGWIPLGEVFDAVYSALGDIYDYRHRKSEVEDPDKYEVMVKQALVVSLGCVVKKTRYFIDTVREEVDRILNEWEWKPITSKDKERVEEKIRDVEKVLEKINSIIQVFEKDIGNRNTTSVPPPTPTTT